MSANISFAQNLQSEGGQKAIMFRLETELRILETLKRFLTVQVRLEKEHSVAIGNAATSAMRAINSVLTENTESVEIPMHKNQNGSGTELTESVISKETVHVLQEIHSTFTNTKRNAAFLEANTLTELTDLICQKKILLKSGKTEYGRIKGILNQYADSISKQKADYFKCFNLYESARTKFENNCAKAIPGSSENTKNSADLRGKFIQMKERLNLSHTQYLILIQEARVYDRDFRTILLPSLLQIEQIWCEKQLTQWSQILDDILNNCSGISQVTRLRLKEFEFGKEYTQLLNKHKSPPLAPMDFKFEPARMSSQPVAQGSLIVESSTINFLKRKLGEVEKRLKDAGMQLVEKQAGKNTSQSDALVEHLKAFDILVTKCDIDRLKHLKAYYEAHLPGMSSATKIDTLSLSSERSLKKGKGNRFAKFLRNATTLTLTKKSVSLDEESQPDSFKANNSANNGGTGKIPNGVEVKDLAKGVSDEVWFHGVLPREDVIRLLKLQGDYLLRETVKNGEQQLVLSVLWNGNKHFMVQKTLNAQFQFEGPIFMSVKELLEHYAKAKIPITNRSGAIIVNPVKREKWELNNDDVELIEKIGKGNFGDVYKAVVSGTFVAVKTCKVDLPQDQKRKFLREARILQQYNHPNIVQFIGICAQKQPIMIAMELVPGGSLLTYLKGKGKLLVVKTLTRMCLDAAAGMKYLEEKNCLHRDLAARNCLIDETNLNLKISDFGMSREEHEYTVSDGMKQIPIKWTAPEALNYGKYTTLSDCWSFGILMWEIFSQGSTPYPGMTNSKAREMIEAGYRMPGPQNVPDIIYQLMMRCWQYEPAQRPRFSEIHLEIEVILNSDLI